MIILGLACLGLLTTAIFAQGPESRPIGYGETVSGVLDDAHYEQRWTFTAQRGDVIQATMTRSADIPGGLDGYLLLIGPDGATLAEVDDTGDSVMPTLEAYELPADGQYTLIATRFGFANGYSAGEYALTLERLGRQAPAGARGGTGARWLAPGTLPPGLRWLTYNEPVSGRLDADHHEDWYIFQGRAGDVITLRMTAEGGTLDPFLILTDGAGYELARADDTPDGLPDAVIAELSLPADGAYLVRATRYGFEHGPSAGAYTLVIETDALPVGASAAPPIPVTPGLPVSGKLDLERAIQRYTFTVQADQQVTLVAVRTAGTLTPALTLRGPDGTLLATGQVWLNPAEVRLGPVTLPADGLYTADVSLTDLSASGAYQLIVILAQPAALPSSAFVPAEGLELEAVLLWASVADLNLSVVSPAGAEGRRDMRANDFCAEGRTMPVERVTWADGTAAPGVYAVSVQYSLDCGGTGTPVRFMLGLAVRGSVVDVIGGVLARPGDTYTTYLTVR